MGHLRVRETLEDKDHHWSVVGYLLPVSWDTAAQITEYYSPLGPPPPPAPPVIPLAGFAPVCPRCPAAPFGLRRPPPYAAPPPPSLQWACGHRPARPRVPPPPRPGPPGAARRSPPPQCTPPGVEAKRQEAVQPPVSSMQTCRYPDG